MVNVEKKDGFAPRLEAATAIMASRRREIARVFGTPFYAGEDPRQWRPYHTLENFRSTTILQTVCNAAMSLRDLHHGSPTLQLQLVDAQHDLPAMMLAASFFYPEFGDFHKADATLAHKKMREAGVFRPRDFKLVTALIDAAISKGSSDLEESPVVKEIGSGDPFVIHKKIFLDAMNNFSVLPDTTFLIPLVAVERLYDSIRKGNSNAIYTADGRLPRNLAEVMSASTNYDSDKVRNQIQVYDRYFFGGDNAFTPHLPTTPFHLAYFDQNRDFYHEHILPLTQQSHIDLASLLQATSAFSSELRREHSQRGRGLLD
jgi:hypothetical protein